MEIARYHRQIKQDPSAGEYIATPSNTSATEQQLLNTVTQTTLALEEDRLKAEHHTQSISAKIKYKELVDEYKNNELDPNNTEKWKAGFEEKLNEINSEVLEGLGARAKAELGTWQKVQNYQDIKSLLSEKDVIDKRNYQKSYELNKVSSMGMTAKKSLDPKRGITEYTTEQIDNLEQFGLQPKEGVVEQLIIGQVELTSENFRNWFERNPDYDNPMFSSTELSFDEAELWLKKTKIVRNINQLELFKETHLENAQAIDAAAPDQKDKIQNGMDYLNSLNPKDYDFLDNDDLDDMKRDYKTAKNVVESQIKAERDLQARTIEKDIFKLQTSNAPEDKQKALELYNSPEAQELLSTSVLRTLNNGFDKTKDVNPVDALKGHAEATVTMVAYRAGTLPFPKGSSALEEAKKIVYEQVSLGHLEREDAEGMIEELTGFKKSPTAASGTATAMDLGIESIKRMKKFYSEILEAGGQKYTTGEVIEGENIPREIVKSDAKYNQQIIDAQAYFNANPGKTPTEVNKYFELLNAPAKDELAKEIVKRKWFKGVTGAEYGRWYPSQVEKKKSPYPEYPDAYQEKGNWYIMKDGDRYRIND